MIIPSVSAYPFESIEKQLTTDQEDQFDPSISGGFTVYTDRKNSDADIYYYDIENNQEVQITEGGGDQFFNDISGNLVAYTDYGAGNADIYVYNIENATTRQITDLTSNQRNPSISGNLIVYEDDRNGNLDIYLLKFQFASDMDDIIAFFDASVEAGTLWGNGDLPWIANKRLKVFRCMLVTAGTLIDEGDFGWGCLTLERIYRRSDGYLRPPDFIAGDACEELAAMILQLRY